MKINAQQKSTVNFVLYSMVLTFIPSVIIFIGFTLWTNLSRETDFMLSLSSLMFVLLPVLLIGGSAIVLALPELLVFVVSKIIGKPVTYLELDARMEDVAKIVKWTFNSLFIGMLANALFPIILGMYWGALCLILIALTMPVIGHFTYFKIFELVDSFEFKKSRKKQSGSKRATA